MLNLHPPFRFATPDDAARAASLAPDLRPGSVVAFEGDDVVAAMSGEPAGETWRVAALAVSADQVEALGPRILAVADALAADEGLASVTLDAAALDEPVRAILDAEGFRPATDGLWARPVVPQG